MSNAAEIYTGNKNLWLCFYAVDTKITSQAHTLNANMGLDTQPQCFLVHFYLLLVNLQFFMCVPYLERLRNFKTDLTAM